MVAGHLKSLEDVLHRIEKERRKHRVRPSRQFVIIFEVDGAMVGLLLFGLFKWDWFCTRSRRMVVDHIHINFLPCHGTGGALDGVSILQNTHISYVSCRENAHAVRELLERVEALTIRRQAFRTHPTEHLQNISALAGRVNHLYAPAVRVLVGAC